MAKLMALAGKDLRVLFADKGNVFWVFGFPTLFALLFGAIYAGAEKGPSGLEVAVVDEDQSELSGLYVTHLQSEAALKVLALDREPALTRVRKGQVAAAVVLRPGFGEGFSTFFDANDPKLQIASDPGRKMEAAYLEGLLAKTQFEVLTQRFRDRQWMRGQMDTWRSQIKSTGGLLAADTNVYLRLFDSLDSFLQDVNDRTYAGGLGNGMLNVARLDVQREYRGPRTPFQITFPQAILWAILSCAATFAISIVRERTTGTYQRLCVGPISQAHILAGKGLACLATCVVVIALLILLGRLIFRVPIESPLLFAAGALCTCLCFVGLMMLVSTLGKTEQSVGGAAWASLMVMAMLGGAMVPLAFMPGSMRSISHISPVKWGILAMEGGIWRHFSPAEMLLPCGLLLVLAVAFFALGVLMLRRAQL
ncbi:MAG: ABC transporter permease [Planctomycetes bacterium]|jgi:ABC-2 type transport system permease protein|nr:ABC transporter permease [Planctomycetota bacterium]